jgi:hypothetical protein
MFQGEFVAKGHVRASRVSVDCAGTLTGCCVTAGGLVVVVVGGAVVVTGFVVTTGRVVVVVRRAVVHCFVRHAIDWAWTAGCDAG